MASFSYVSTLLKLFFQLQSIQFNCDFSIIICNHLSCIFTLEYFQIDRNTVMEPEEKSKRGQTPCLKCLKLYNNRTVPEFCECGHFLGKLITMERKYRS